MLLMMKAEVELCPCRDESASKKVCYLCKKKVPHDDWNSGDHRKKCAKSRQESSISTES